MPFIVRDSFDITGYKLGIVDLSFSHSDIWSPWERITSWFQQKIWSFLEFVEIIDGEQKRWGCTSRKSDIPITIIKRIYSRTLIKRPSPILRPPLLSGRGHFLAVQMRALLGFTRIKCSFHLVLKRLMMIRVRNRRWRLIKTFKHTFIIVLTWSSVFNFFDFLPRQLCQFMTKPY